VVLRMSLKVDAAQHLRTTHRDLPWGHRYNALTIVAVPVGPSAEALAAQPAWDEPIESPEIVLVPGKALSGNVYLNSRVQGAEAALAKGELLVFWSYQLVAIGQPASNRVGGWLVIPRRADRSKNGELQNNELQRTRPAQAMEPRR
jgi:hypothetical protein